MSGFMDFLSGLATGGGANAPVDQPADVQPPQGVALAIPTNAPSIAQVQPQASLFTSAEFARRLKDQLDSMRAAQTATPTAPVQTPAPDQTDPNSWQTQVNPAPNPQMPGAVASGNAGIMAGNAAGAQNQPSPTSAAPAQTASVAPPSQVSQPQAQTNPLDNQGFFSRFQQNLAKQTGMPDRFSQNLTYQALIGKGMDPTTAAGMVVNPALMSAAGPALFSPKTQVVNNQLINSQTGQVIQDFRDTATSHPVADFINPATQENVKAAYDPRIQGHVAPNGDIYSGPLAGKNINRLVASNAPQQQLGIAPIQQAQNSGQGGGGGGQPVQVQGDPTAASFAQPPAQQNSASVYAIPATIPGADAKLQRDEATKKMADEIANDREKGIGAIDFLQQAQTAKDLIDKYGNVIGRYAEPTESHATGGGIAGDVVNAVANLPAQAIQIGRNAVGSLGGDLPDGRNTFGADNAARDELRQTFTKLAQAGLKATYGGRVTNVDVKQQEQTVPRLTNQDATSAQAILENGTNQAWNTLQRNIDSGAINVASIPPAIIQQGVTSGKLKIRGVNQ